MGSVIQYSQQQYFSVVSFWKFLLWLVC